MAWSFTNLIIQILGGVIGAPVAAALINEKPFVLLVQMSLGAGGAALSGCFLQTIAVTMVTGTGSLNELTQSENIALQALMGMSAGGIAMLAIVILRSGGEYR